MSQSESKLFGHSAFTLGSILNTPYVEQPYLLRNMIYKHGKTVLVGKPKSGKSWLAIKISVSLAKVEECLGFGTTKAPVLYLEFDRRRLDMAIHEIAGDKETEDVVFVPLQLLAINTDDGFKTFEGIIKAFCQRYKEQEVLVVIDHKSFSFFGKENDDVPNKIWKDNLDRVAKDLPVTYLVLAQAPKGWGGDVVDLPFGSRALGAWADTIISVTPSGRSFRRLDVVSNYGDVEPLIYDKEFTVYQQEEIEAPKLARAVECMREIWDEFPLPSKKVEKAKVMAGCGWNTAWDAYKQVRDERIIISK